MPRYACRDTANWTERRAKERLVIWISKRGTVITVSAQPQGTAGDPDMEQLENIRYAPRTYASLPDSAGGNWSLRAWHGGRMR